MHAKLRNAIEHEFGNAKRRSAADDVRAAFSHLERAHVLGQLNTAMHVRAHWAMLKFGWPSRDRREIAGQLTRLTGAALFTWLWVPEGNTGGANVGAFEKMPIPPELRQLIDTADPKA